MWYFLISPETWTLMGLMLVTYLIAVGIKSAAGKISSGFKSHERPISLQRSSTDGKFRVCKAGYDESLELYFADIERVKDGRVVGTVVGHTQKEMERRLEDDLEWHRKNPSFYK